MIQVRQWKWCHMERDTISYFDLACYTGLSTTCQIITNPCRALLTDLRFCYVITGNYNKRWGGGNTESMC
jgi:hypothetical protein